MEGIISQIFRLFVIVLLVSCVKAYDSINQCGRLRTIQPTILGRNVTFSFTPDTKDPDAQLEWLRTNNNNPWAVLPPKYKFTQYHQDGKYYLVLTDTVRRNDEVYYQVHYYNESMHCYMNTPILQLEDKSREPCGFVNLRTTRPIEGDTVEIEYYPPKYVLRYPGNFERTWVHLANQTSFRINLNEDMYEEEVEQNDKYVLRIFHVYSRMNGVYSVSCGRNIGYSKQVSVQILVPPSAPTFKGLQNIDGCKQCIVGESGDQMQINCKTSGGTKPIDVNISVGSEVLRRKPQPYDSIPGYIASFKLIDRYHMKDVTFTIKNEALASHLNVTAKVYVIKPPESLLITAPRLLKEEESVNITCISDGARPSPKLTINISGIEVSPVQHTNYFNKATYLNTDVVSLTTFNRNWNQENITCCRYSEWYKNKMECSTPTQVNYLYAPVVKLNMSGPIVDIHKGEQEYVKCLAQSVPASNITWIELLDNDIDVTKNQCLLATDCVMKIDTQLVLKRDFLCQAQYLKIIDHKILIVNIIEKKEERLRDNDNSVLSGKAIIWIIAGTVLGVSTILLITFLVMRHRRRNTEAKRNRDSTNVDVDRRKDEERANPLHANLNEVAHAHNIPEATYTKLDVIMAANAADCLYSELSNPDNSNPLDSLSKHSKTVAQLAIESQTAEVENVYVNEKVK